MAAIEKGEQRLKRKATILTALDAKMSAYKDPFYQLKIHYGPGQRSKQFSEEEDRYVLLPWASKCGMSSAFGHHRWQRSVQTVFHLQWFKNNVNDVNNIKIVHEISFSREKCFDGKKKFGHSLNVFSGFFWGFNCDKCRLSFYRFILCNLYRLGVDNEKVYEEILALTCKSSQFRFDWWLRSRTPAELQKRCAVLINLVEKEMTADKEEKEQRKHRKVGPSAQAGTAHENNSGSGKKRNHSAPQGGEVSRGKKAKTVESKSDGKKDKLVDGKADGKKTKMADGKSEKVFQKVRKV